MEYGVLTLTDGERYLVEWNGWTAVRAEGLLFEEQAPVSADEIKRIIDLADQAAWERNVILM